MDVITIEKQIEMMIKEAQATANHAMDLARWAGWTSLLALVLSAISLSAFFLH